MIKYDTIHFRKYAHFAMHINIYTSTIHIKLRSYFCASTFARDIGKGSMYSAHAQREREKGGI